MVLSLIAVFASIGILLLLLMLVAAALAAFGTAVVLLLVFACKTPARRRCGEKLGKRLALPLWMLALSLPILLFVFGTLGQAMAAPPPEQRSAEGAEIVRSFRLFEFRAPLFFPGTE